MVAVEVATEACILLDTSYVLTCTNCFTLLISFNPQHSIVPWGK